MKNLLLILSLYWVGSAVFGQFAELPFTWRAAQHNALLPADTDGDGDIDFFSSDHIEGPRFVENKGDNLFEHPVYLTDYVDSYVEHALIDLENDGDPDLIGIRMVTGQIIGFKNMGGNEFSEFNIHETGEFGISDLNVADIDGDGDQDISFRLSASIVKWLENDGTGSFSPAIIFDDGVSIGFHHNFDGDGDGDLDVCIFETPFTLSYMENLGGSYAAPILITAADPNIERAISFDYDEDGDIDLFYEQTTETVLKVVENLGDGTFATPVIFTTLFGSTLFPFTDIDGDGRLDFVAGSSIYDVNMYWKRNLGGGVYESLELMAQITGPNLVTEFIDMNLDGKLDMVHAGHQGSMLYYKNLDDGAFATGIYISETAIGPRWTHSFDPDNDGDQDLFCASTIENRISWVENLSDGHFSEIKTAVAQNLLYPLHISSSDIDGDGFEDLLGISNGGACYWVKNMADGTFADPVTFSTELMFPTSIIGDDWDGDGDNDIMVGTKGDYVINLYENLDGIFSPTGVTLTDDFVPNPISSHDLDGDGDLDILYTSNADNRLRWLENNGAFSFTQHNIGYYTPGNGRNKASDMDGDGDPDIITLDPAGDEVKWVENLGGGLFGSPVVLETECDLPRIADFADVNNDGIGDLIVGSAGDNTIAWYPGLPGDEIDFGPRNILTDDLIQIESILIEDLDQDGDNDIVFVDSWDWKWTWFENLHFATHTARGTIFVDLNENGLNDDEDLGIHVAQALCSPESYFAFTNTDGEYIIAYDETELGDYTVYPEIAEYWGLTTAPSYDITIDGGFTLYENLDFGVAPTGEFNHVNPYLTGGRPRTSVTTTYWLNYSNAGTTFPSGNLHLELDEKLTYMGANIAPTSIDGQHIYWAYEDLFYFEDAGVEVSVKMPNFESLGEHVTSYFTVDVESGGDIVYFQMDSLDQIIQGSYDPNDKTANPAGTTEYGYIDPDTESIEYLIRFQNTGTDTAYIVTIEDQLDPNLDWSSLRPLAWSHDMVIEADHDGLISFVFDNIMLPDSNVNELASNGFVKYEIDLLPGLPLETSIYNTAHIFFDFNPAIITNTSVNTLHVDEGSGIAENGENQITVYPNPFSDVTTIKFGEELTGEHTLVIYDILGTEVYRLTNITGQQIQISKNNIGSGLYFLSVLNSDSKRILTTKLFAE